MKSLISKQVERFLREQKNYKRWLAVFLCLAVMVTIGTTAALKYKGIAVTSDADAAQEMHMEEAADQEPAAQEMSVDGEATVEEAETAAGHVHTDACYEEREVKVLVCDAAKAAEGHKHDDSCYEITGGTETLTCGKEEHTHSSDCYETKTKTVTRTETDTVEDGTDENGNPITREVEKEVTEEVTEEVLTCGMEEHTHSSDCYEIVGGEKTLICGMEEGEGAVESDHVHDDSCYETRMERVLVCGFDEDSEEDGEEEVIPVPVEEEYKAGKLTAEGEDYKVVVSYTAGAKIPEGAELKVEEIEKDSETYKECYNQMMEALTEEADGEEPEVSFIRFFDITIFADGEEKEPDEGVTVRISYDDAVIDDTEQKGFAVHFPKKGDTEIMDAEVKDGKEFEFDQSGFSITGAGGMGMPLANGGELVAEGDDYKITVKCDENVSLPAGASLKVEEIENNNSNNKSGNNSYRKFLNNSEGAIKEKKNGKGEESGTDETAFARFFEISVEDKNENAIELNGKAEIKVEYDDAFTADAVGTAAMVFNTEDSSEVLGNLTDMQEGDEISEFKASRKLTGAMTFGIGTMVMADAGNGIVMASETGTEGEHNFDPSYLTDINRANEWQIGDEPYTGNGEGKKKADDETDPKVRVQKNVIPTDVENEFYVYLSIDVKTTVSEQIDENGFTVVGHQGGKPGEPTHDNNPQTLSIKRSKSETSGYDYVYGPTTFRDYNQKPIPGYTDIYLCWYGNENITPGYRRAPDAVEADPGKRPFYVLANKIHTGQVRPYIDFTKTFFDEIVKYHQETSILDEVEDEMGPYITCEEIIGGDYFSISADAKSIKWKPAVDPTCDTSGKVTGKGEYWNLNAAQLLYKVKLDVTAPGFPSCAEHINDDPVNKKCDHFTHVNNKAVLTYGEKGEDGKRPTIDFQQPTVRGLLYDITVKKTDEDDNTKLLPDAKFEIRGKNVEPYDVSDIVEELATSKEEDDKGTLKFPGLPCGTYELWETVAPTGYQSVGNDGIKIGEFKVCYTDNKDCLDLENISVGQANINYKNADPTKGLITDNNGYVSVTNKKNPTIKVRKVWDDEENNKHRPESVTFKIEYYSDGGWSSIPSQIDENKNVIVDADGCVTLVASGDSNTWEMVVENLPETTEEGYRVTEVIDPDLDEFYEIVTDDKDGNPIYKDGVTGSAIDEEEEIPLYTITNTLKKRIVNLTKVDADTIEDEEKGPEYLKGATFELYKKRPESNHYNDDKPEDIIEKTSTDKGEITEANFKLALGEYWLIETKAPGGYEDDTIPKVFILKVAEESVTLCYEDGSIVAGSNVKDSNEVRVPNTPKKVKLLKKETGSSKYLPDAEFKVEYTSNDEKHETYYWKSGDDGVIGVDGDQIVPITKLPLGTYILTETKAPDGYNLLENAITMTVKVDKITLTGPGIDTNNSDILYEKDDSTGEKCYRIEIANSAGLELPETGGPGTVAYTFGGLAMIIAVSLMYGLNMRRKREGGIN